ncbi:unnamed protein product [Prunus armeniaca]
MCKSISRARPKPGERPPRRAQAPSSARKEARAKAGSHQPRQAQGQVPHGLQSEGCDVNADIIAR